MRIKSLAAPLALYLVISASYFGLPVAAHPGRTIIGTGADPEIFIWMFAWWPHALAHGLDPFRTNEIWTPDTYNLAWTTSVPGLAALFAPVTLLAGPVASYNLAAVLMPALAAWTAYLLCRYLTGRTWLSLAGGYLFGFSSYMQNAVFPSLFLGQVPGNGPDDILAFARSVGATAIVVQQRGDPGWARFFSTAIRPDRVGGVVAFPLEPGPEGSAACRKAVRG